VKGGVTATTAIEGSFGVRSEARRYAVGPTVEFRLPRSFAVEVDALYRRTGYSTTDTAFGITTAARIRANVWEFPILAKHTLPGRGLPVRPSVAAGYVVRRASGVKETVHTFGRNPVTGEPVDTTDRLDTRFVTRDNPTNGVTVGGGANLRAGPLRIAPELRYTRWLGRLFDEQGSRGFFVRSTSNQVDVLVGVTF